MLARVTAVVSWSSEYGKERHSDFIVMFLSGSFLYR